MNYYWEMNYSRMANVKPFKMLDFIEGLSYTVYCIMHTWVHYNINMAYSKLW